MKLICCDKAYAKINFGLNVYKKNKNQNKHKIKSLFILAKQYYDEIEIYEASSLKIEYIFKNNKQLIKNDIIKKTIEYFQDNFHIKCNFYIKVYKHIPISSGLGGSSTDGACIASFIIKYFNLHLSKKDFKKIALNLSSDLLFFLFKYDSALVSSYGHKIKPVNLCSSFNFKIILTGIKCDTKMIYEAFDSYLKNHKIKRNNFHKIINHINDINNCIIINNLEPIALDLFPCLKQYKKSNTILTGSGSSFIEWKE